MSDRLTQLHLARPGPHEKSGQKPKFCPTSAQLSTRPEHKQNPTEKISHTLWCTPGLNYKRKWFVASGLFDN